MDSVRLGFFDSPIHEATAAVITRVLEAHGIMDIDFITGEKEALIQGLKAGDFDLFVTLWLPDIHAGIMKENPNLKAIGTLYQPSLCLVLPKGFEGQLISIEQLKDSVTIGRQVKVSEILHDAASQLFTAYGLFEAGYELLSVSDEEAFQWGQETLDSQTANLLVLADPSILLDRQDYYRVQDPKGILNKEQRASIILNMQHADRLGVDVVDELEGMVVGNQIVRYLEQAVRMDHMDADEAAETWQRGKLVVRT